MIVEVAEQAFGIVCMDLPERESKFDKDHEDFEVTFHYEYLDDFKEVDNEYEVLFDIQMSITFIIIIIVIDHAGIPKRLIRLTIVFIFWYIINIQFIPQYTEL